MARSLQLFWLFWMITNICGTTHVLVRSWTSFAKLNIKLRRPLLGIRSARFQKTQCRRSLPKLSRTRSVVNVTKPWSSKLVKVSPNRIHPRSQAIAKEVLVMRGCQLQSGRRSPLSNTQESGGVHFSIALSDAVLVMGAAMLMRAWSAERSTHGTATTEQLV